ncbi:MAG: MerR family transcriptional regulator [Longimicrobiales bacterium]|nr:MerR family transcriptional regulator [Longimicrobiales bacterium]
MTENDLFPEASDAEEGSDASAPRDDAPASREMMSAPQLELGGGEEPIARKVYYAIGEVCDLTGLKPHVLRYWENQFEVLTPTKNRAGNRVYRPKDIELILLVKHLLYEEKYTIEGARQRLLEMRRAGELAEERQVVLEPEFLSGMKAELNELRSILDRSSPDDT